MDEPTDASGSVALVITVLVAADSDWLHTLLRTALLADDARIVEVRDGRAVRAAVIQHEVDIAVLDIQCGSMGGIAVAMDLQLEAADDRLPAVPVVLLLDREADRMLASRVRTDAILVKPCNAAAIRQVVLATCSKIPSAS